MSQESIERKPDLSKKEAINAMKEIVERLAEESRRSSQVFFATNFDYLQLLRFMIAIAQEE